jgi:acyl-CoA thioesterase-1
VQRSVVSTILAGFGILVCAFVCAACLTGCKADAGKADPGLSAQVSIQQPAATVPDGRPVVACFGDSLTAGLGTDPGQSYPDYLQKILNDANYPYRVVNEGVSGNTTKDGLNRIGRILALHPVLVVVEFGGNDGLRGLPLEQTKSNLGSIIEQLQAAHTRVALAGITLPPDYGPDYIAKFNAMYPALAKQYHLPMLPFLLQNVYGVPGDMQDDKTHATAQGNKQVAANVAGLIEPMLKH